MPQSWDSFALCIYLRTFARFAHCVLVAGTPIWFGFGNLGLAEADFLEISYKAGVCLTIASIAILPTLVLTVTCPRAVLRQNIVFLFAALASVMLPAMGLSLASYEFPALLGGMIGCGLTAMLIHFRVGLANYEAPEGARDPLDIDTISDQHSVISANRKKRERKQVAELEDGTIQQIPAMQLPIVPEEVSTQHEFKEFGHQPSSISEVSVSGRDKTAPGTEDNVLEGGDDGYCHDSDQEVIETHLGPRKSYSEGYVMELVGRTFPIWGTVFLLVLTRIPQIGLRQQLTRLEPSVTIYLGTYGTFKLSASLVFQLLNILSYPQLNWRFELLFIPFLVPFTLISILTMALYRKDLQCHPHDIVGTVTSRLRNPAIALMGALVMVELLINGGPASPASLIGVTLSGAFGGGWVAIAAFVGALGSFFSGSTTVSNLTFGEIQQIAAENTGISKTALLALQAAGASAGNGVCLNNIISGCAVVALKVGEGKLISKTAFPVFCFCVAATVVSLAFFIRF